MNRLDGKVAIVTGGTGGIGQAITELFAKEGAKVAIFDIAKKEATQLLDRVGAATGQSKFYEVDITSSTAVERAVRAVSDDLGPVDILVNNAAIPGTSRLTHEARRVTPGDLIYIPPNQRHTVYPTGENKIRALCFAASYQPVGGKFYTPVELKDVVPVDQD